MTLEDLRQRCRMEDGHWIWIGAMSEGRPKIWAPDHTSGDGQMRSQPGRRAVWHVKHGKALPDGWRVFGTCERGDCIAPHHLEAKEPAEKGAEVAASGKLKGRIVRIAANRAIGRRRSVLNQELIGEILSSNESGEALAARLKIGRTTISKVRMGKSRAFEPVGGLFTGLMGRA